MIKNIFFPKSKFAFLATLFFITSFIWSIVTPLGASPDEGAHIQYARAIVQGEYSQLENQGWVTDLPANIATINDNELCYFQQVQNPGQCHLKIDSSANALVETQIRVPGYPPFYYVVVGWPLIFGFSEATWYVMRILSVVLCSAIITTALFSSRKIVDNSFVYGFLLAITPLVTFLVGSVSPSSLEITSGIAFGMMLFSYPQLSKSGNWHRNQWLSLIFIACVLAASRPLAWIFIFCFFVTIYLRFVSKKNPFLILIFYGLLTFIALAGIIYLLKSGVIDSGRFMPPALPQQMVEAHFSKLDNYIYDTVGYFAWIMSYKGLELIHIFWIGLILLLVVWSFQSFTLRENLSLLLFSSISTIAIPLAVYYFVFKAGYGYQARYAMALLCSIPLLAVIGVNRNLLISDKQISIAAIFVPLANVSDWFISGFRYSYGLPFQFLSWGGDRTYSIWLSKPFIIVCFLSFIYYVALNIHFYKKLNLPN